MNNQFMKLLIITVAISSLPALGARKARSLKQGQSLLNPSPQRSGLPERPDKTFTLFDGPGKIEEIKNLLTNNFWPNVTKLQINESPPKCGLSADKIALLGLAIKTFSNTLIHLNLYGSNLGKSDKASQIIEEIGNIKNLKYLEFGNSILDKGDVIKSLELALKKLPGLIFLDLGGNHFSKDKTDIIVSIMKTLPLLQTLDFSRNGCKASVIAKFLTKLPALKNIDLSYNKIGTISVKCIVEVIKEKHPDIEILDLRHNNLGEKGSKYKLTNKVSKWLLIEKGAEYVVNSLKDRECINLQLSGNNISNEEKKHLQEIWNEERLLNLQNRKLDL